MGVRAGKRALTTEPGFVNGNGQVVVAGTGAASSRRADQRVYRLRCGKCRHEYGANGMEIHLRLCPQCQGGVAGEVLVEVEGMPPLFS